MWFLSKTKERLEVSKRGKGAVAPAPTVSQPPEFLSPFNDAQYDEEFYDGRPEKIVLLASTPRVGSGLLWEGLHSVGAVPKSTELFEEVHMRDFFKRWGELSKEDYVARLFNYRTNIAGIFGVKAHHQQYIRFQELLPIKDCQVILLEREDKIDQAISHLIAAVTQKWGPAGKAVCQPDENIYDYHRLRGYLQNVIDGTKFWCALLADNGIEPKYVVYSNLACQYSDTIAALAEWITGAEIKAADVGPPRREVQRNDLNRKLKERFVKDLWSFGVDAIQFHKLFWPEYKSVGQAAIQQS